MVIGSIRRWLLLLIVAAWLAGCAGPGGGGSSAAAGAARDATPGIPLPAASPSAVGGQGAAPATAGAARPAPATAPAPAAPAGSAAGATAPPGTATAGQPATAAQPGSTEVSGDQAWPWPAAGWPTATPEEQGVDAQALVSIINDIQQRGMHIHSLLVIRHGYALADLSFYPFAPSIKHEQFSITKAVTSAAIGSAVAEGKLRLDQPILSFFQDRRIANLDERKQAIPVANLLNMTGGFAWDESSVPYGNPNNMETRMSHSPDWVQFVLDQPMADQPGTKWVYNSGEAHLLSAILQKATGQTLLDYARAHLFQPLGISDVKWPSDPQGITEGHIDLWLQPRDMAKLGYLYLRAGQWDGRQVLPADWIKLSTEKNGGPNPNFGYQWRRPPFDAFEAVGWGSQLIGVVPSQDLVVVITAGVAPGEPEPEEKLFGDISQQAVKAAGALPPNPGADAALLKLTRQAAQPAPQPVPPLPATAAAISGKTYRIAGAPDGLQSLSLTFGASAGANAADSATGAAAKLDLVVNGRPRRLALGLDNVFRLTDVGADRHAVRGHWQDGRTLVIEDQILGAADTTTYTLAFAGNRVDGKAASHIEDHTVEIHGQAQ